MAKNIILFLIATALLAGVIVTAALVMNQLKDEIDISDTAVKVFADFKVKALNGEIKELDKKEQKVADKFSGIEDLCLESAASILKDYIRLDVEYQQALDALRQYRLFPVDENEINKLLNRVTEIEEGRSGYNLAMAESDPLTTVLLCSRVDKEDSVYYTKARDIIIKLLDTEELNKYVYENLSKNKTELMLENLTAINDFCETNNDVKSILSYVENFKAEQENTVTYKGPIEILSVRNLMAFPNIVYAEGSKYANSYDSSLITPNEFKSILSSLYKNDYILVSMDHFNADNLYKTELPEGKKPFVLIVEDLTYPDANNGSGVCSSLQIDENGKLCTETDSVRSYDNESVLILEQFLCENPDFTFRGARGCITLTGYDGVFGHDIETENGRITAKKIADLLRDDGWLFACHSYSYTDMHKASMETLRWDTENWANKIEPLVGFSYIYVWPYGSHVRSGEKFEYLKDSGYRVFLGQGIDPFKTVEDDGSSIFFDRRALTGYALHNYGDKYSHLFNTNDVLDDIRPKKEEQEN